MALYSDLPVYRACYRLLLDIHRLSPHVPRDVRYTTVSRLTDRIENIIGLIFETNAARQKTALLARMRTEMAKVSVEIRLLADLKAISEKQYVLLIEQADGIARQLASWHKSEMQKVSAGKTEEAGMPPVTAGGSAHIEVQ